MDFKNLFKREYFAPHPDKPILDISTMADTAGKPITSEPIHIHEWIQKIVSYAAPRRDIGAYQTMDPEVLQAALLGVTSVLFECGICHEPRKEVMLGSTINQLDDIMDKTETYGPQYVQRNNVTFVIQRYVPPVAGVQVR